MGAGFWDAPGVWAEPRDPDLEDRVLHTYLHCACEWLC